MVVQGLWNWINLPQHPLKEEPRQLSETLHQGFLLQTRPREIFVVSG